MHRHTLRDAAGPMGARVLCLCFFFAGAMPAQGPGAGGIGNLHRPTFTSFDAPGAASGDGQGTEPASVNAEGTIAGFYDDANNVLHSFVRAIDGTIATFDAPDAGTSSGQGGHCRRKLRRRERYQSWLCARRRWHDNHLRRSWRRRHLCLLHRQERGNHGRLRGREWSRSRVHTRSQRPRHNLLRGPRRGQCLRPGQHGIQHRQFGGHRRILLRCE